MSSVPHQMVVTKIRALISMTLSSRQTETSRAAPVPVSQDVSPM